MVDPYLSSTHEEVTVALLFLMHPHPLRSWVFQAFRLTFDFFPRKFVACRSHLAAITIIKRKITDGISHQIVNVSHRTKQEYENEVAFLALILKCMRARNVRQAFSFNKIQP